MSPAFGLVFAAVFLGMEAVAWLTHKYVMHGFLWSWHLSHHEPRRGAFEKNDLFGLFFSAVAIALILAGLKVHALFLAAGLGMTAYGAAYLFLHDILNHKRFGIRLKPRSGYLRAVLRSHRVHHARREKEGCVSFGFLIPVKFERLQGAKDARKGERGK
jgi:beta-carotene 3-hydroxylase